MYHYQYRITPNAFLGWFLHINCYTKAERDLKKLETPHPGGGWDKHISEKNGINVLPAEGVLVFFLMPLNTT